MSASLANISTCGLLETLLFVLAVLFGTGCSICSKIMMDLEGGTNGTFDARGEPVMEVFQQPLFLTFTMFLGMLFGLVLHWVVVQFRIPFPGYDFDNGDVRSDAEGDGGLISERTPLVGDGWGDDSDASVSVHYKRTPAWMYFFLAIPAVFDLGATALW